MLHNNLQIDDSLRNQVMTALDYVSSDCSRDDWFKVLCSIHDALGQDGYSLARAWSQKSSKFDEKNFNYTWQHEVGKKQGVTKAYLFKLAYENGMPKPKNIDSSTKKKDLSIAEQWQRCKPFTSHPYIVEQGLEGKLNGYESVLRLGKDSTGHFIADPILNLENGVLTGFNRIYGKGKGNKKLAKGTHKVGNAGVIGSIDTNIEFVCVTEGLADGLHVHNELKIPMFVASDAGNILNVAKVVRKLTKLPIVICADNDKAGLDAANAAVNEVTNCFSAIPPFGKDFTESVLNGDDIATVIRNAIATPAKKTPAVTPVNVKNYRLHLPRLNDKFKPINCIENIEFIFKHDKAWHGVLGFNEFTQKVTKLKKPPFENSEVGEWTDTDDTDTSLWLSKEYDMLNVDEGKVLKIAHVCSLSNKYHPVRDYLNSLKWDGIERVYTFLPDTIGCNDTEYARAIIRCFFIGAVARIFEPGCKLDTLPIIEGEQGIYKSTMFKSLCHDPNWFSDTPIDIGNKDAYLSLNGKWIKELSELDSLTRAEATAAKAFFSSPDDYYRAPYDKANKSRPRQSVFVGTVNGETYLKDSTGNRRYHPIKAEEEIDLKYVVESRDQLWAEAVHLYKRGVKWWIDSNDAVYAEVVNQQSARVDTDVWQPKVEEWLVIKEQVTSQEILRDCLEIETCKQTQREKTRVANIMQSLGWKRTQVRDKTDKNRRKWYYVKKS
jgi:predicted P-loop ATPase